MLCLKAGELFRCNQNIFYTKPLNILPSFKPVMSKKKEHKEEKTETKEKGKLSEEVENEECAVRVIENEGVVEEITIETSIAGDKVEELIPVLEQGLNTKL